MKYLSFALSFLGFFFGCASLWVFFNWGTVSVQQVLANLVKINTISHSILFAFALYVLLPAALLTLLPDKIRLPLLVVAVAFGVYVFNIVCYVQNKNVYSSLYEDDFVIINAENITHPKKKKNLLVIYVESLEEQYSNPKFSGEVLTPYLQEQKKNALHFDGYFQLPATKYTLAGMMTSQCGIRDHIDFEKIAAIPNMYPQIACIPDILAKNGYQNYFYNSADLEFANTVFYAQQHSFSTMKGYKAWKKENPDNPDIQGNSWGVRDSFLYQQIKKTILDMEQKNKPYSIFAMTVDTHGELEFIDPICKQPEISKKNLIKCTDLVLGDFIEWCKNQPFYKDMTIVIMGDHTAHGTKNEVYLKQPKERQIENIILNSVRTDKKRHQWTAFDMAPTIMEAIGYDMPAMGLGRSLFAEKQTLIEKYGKKLDQTLQQNSRFLQKLSDYALPDKKVFFKIETGKKYTSEQELRQFIPYSNQAEFIIGRLWFKHLNIQVKESKDYTLRLKAVALKKKADRTFGVLVNNQKIGELTFEKDKTDPVAFSAKIPLAAIKNGKFKLKFENQDIKHWSILSTGIGIDEFSLL